MNSKKLKKLDIYIPILFKLQNDSAIIHSTLHSRIRNQMKDTLYNDKLIYSECKDIDEFHFNIDNEALDFVKDLDDSIISIKGHAFYYHHRLIFHFGITYNTIEPAFRIIRMHLIEKVLEFTDVSVIKINNTITEAKDVEVIKNDKSYKYITANLNEIIIKTFYSYCIVFQQKTGEFLKKSNQIQTFNIRTLQPKSMPFNRSSLLRISIPNMTAYYTGKLSTEFTSEIINTIYKICLYDKKIKELPETERINSYDFETAQSHQAINEEMIMDMWSYCIDVFGGKRVDQISNKGAIVGLVFSLTAVVFSIISLVMSLN